MVDIEELKRLASGLAGWQNLTECWPIEDDDCDPEEFDWAVGAIDEDGNDYSVMTVDAFQYDAPGESEKLARFYAAANPAAVLELIAKIERLRKDSVSVDTAVYIAEQLSVKAEQAERERDQLRAELDELALKFAASDYSYDQSTEQLRSEIEALHEAVKFASVVMGVVAENESLAEVEKRSLLCEVRRCDAAMAAKG